MVQNVQKQVAMLGLMSPVELRAKYLEVFGEPTRSGNKSFLCKRLSWRIQSLAEGGLSERARQRAAELARDADIRLTNPRPPKIAQAANQLAAASPAFQSNRLPMPGTIITRQYRGQLIQVKVLSHGFEWEGDVYHSLSAVAKAITGSHWNGHLFFGLSDANRRAQ